MVETGLGSPVTSSRLRSVTVCPVFPLASGSAVRRLTADPDPLCLVHLLQLVLVNFKKQISNQNISLWFLHKRNVFVL